jgi:hypothetical protein
VTLRVPKEATDYRAIQVITTKNCKILSFSVQGNSFDLILSLALIFEHDAGLCTAWEHLYIVMSHAKDPESPGQIISCPCMASFIYLATQILNRSSGNPSDYQVSLSLHVTIRPFG